jgi:hypothetical protein
VEKVVAVPNEVVADEVGVSVGDCGVLFPNEMREDFVCVGKALDVEEM